MSSETEPRYYYCEDGETPVGPFSQIKLRELLTKEVIDRDVWVIEDGNDDWKVVTDYSEFSEVESMFQQGANASLLAALLNEPESSVARPAEESRELATLQSEAPKVDLQRYRDKRKPDRLHTGQRPSKLWVIRMILNWKAVVLLLVLTGVILLLVQFSMNMERLRQENLRNQRESERVVEATPASRFDMPETTRRSYTSREVSTDGTGRREEDEYFVLTETLALEYDDNRFDSVRVVKGSLVTVVNDSEMDRWEVAYEEKKFTVSPEFLRPATQEEIDESQQSLELSPEEGEDDG